MLFLIQFAASQYFPLRFTFFCLRNPTALRNVAELRTKWGDDSVGNVLAAGLRIWVRIPRTHVKSRMFVANTCNPGMVRREEETRKSLDACCPSYSGLLGEVPGLWATLLQTGEAKFLKNVTWDCSPTSTCTHTHTRAQTHTQREHAHTHACKCTNTPISKWNLS